EVTPPNNEARVQILKIHTRNMNLSKDVDFNYLAKLTEGTSGSGLKAIATEAGMFAIRNEKDCVEVDDLINAIKKVVGEKDSSSNVSGNMFA
ncbi:MAG TPA: proteasome-activating nucleotidase, partial [Candidatus Nanoarchaeia archaeon]|nr:proteasome-activating nucleotidase [Candidatus Nanoarchaeia archaeon]